MRPVGNAVKVTFTCPGCGEEHTYEIPTTNAQEYRQAVLRLFYLGGTVEGHDWPGEFNENDQSNLVFLCRRDECCDKVAGPAEEWEPGTRIFARASEQFVFEGRPSLSRG